MFINLAILTYFCYHGYRLIDLTTRHRAETEMETDRLRQAQMQAERLLESRERANRQKQKGMEETVSVHLAVCSVVFNELIDFFSFV